MVVSALYNHNSLYNNKSKQSNFIKKIYSYSPKSSKKIQFFYNFMFSAIKYLK